MIETTHLKLEQAATELETNVATLLIAIAEGRLHASFLLNAEIFAEYGRHENSSGDLVGGFSGNWVSGEPELRHFFFVPLQRQEAAALLQYEDVSITPSDLTLPDEDGRYWKACISCYSNDAMASPYSMVNAGVVFVRRSDIEKISQSQTTPAEIKEPVVTSSKTLPREMRSISLYGTIAALLATWPGGLRALPSLKELEKAGKLVGAEISDSSIKNAILKTREIAAPKLPPLPAK